MNEKSNIELILNIFLRASFVVWTQLDAEELLNFIELFTDNDNEPHLVYYCYNPILTICICSELAGRIGAAMGKFKQRSSGVSGDL